MNDIISKLIASGRAQSGHYVGGGGAVSQLLVPEGKGLIITKIIINAFADLPDTATFLNADAVSAHSWHQLNVWTDKGTQIFNARHDTALNIDGVAGGFFTVPIGKTVFDVWINAEEFVFFTLSHAPQPLTAWTVNIDRVPDNQDIPAPPFNYGITPAGLTTVTNLIYDAGNLFESRPLGEISPQVAATSFKMLQWQINTDSRINPPQPTIPYGSLTIPVINVDYILIDGTPDSTFRGAI